MIVAIVTILCNVKNVEFKGLPFFERRIPDKTANRNNSMLKPIFKV